MKTSGTQCLGLYELKQYMHWLLSFLDQGKQAKMQLVQEPIQSNVCNLKNVRHKAGRLFKSKEKAYWKVKFDELETNIKLKKY